MPDEDYMQGSAYLLKGNFQQAVQYLSFAIVRNNAEERLFLKRGAAYMALSDFSNALHDFNESNTLVPGTGDIWLARLYARTGNKDSALQYLDKHLKSSFRLSMDSLHRDPAFSDLKNTDEWDSLWQIEWYSSGEKALAEVNYYADKGLFDDANRLIVSEMGRNPGNTGLITTRGMVSFKQGDFASAIADFSSALDLNKSDILLYYHRANALLKASRYKDAIADYTKVLKDDPSDFKIYPLRAQSYAGMNNWKSAIDDLLLYLRYFEDDRDKLFQCGYYYYEQGDYIKALRLFNRIIKDDPNHSACYKARGMTYLRTETYQFALSDFAMSLDLNPDDSEAWMFMGIAKIKLGDIANGCSDLQKAQRMGNAEAIGIILEKCQ
jgi:tetratricopeptide (TPR) repeat protein